MLPINIIIKLILTFLFLIKYIKLQTNKTINVPTVIFSTTNELSKVAINNPIFSYHLLLFFL